MRNSIETTVQSNVIAPVPSLSGETEKQYAMPSKNSMHLLSSRNIEKKVSYNDQDFTLSLSEDSDKKLCPALTTVNCVQYDSVLKNKNGDIVGAFNVARDFSGTDLGVQSIIQLYKSCMDMASFSNLIESNVGAIFFPNPQAPKSTCAFKDTLKSFFNADGSTSSLVLTVRTSPIDSVAGCAAFENSVQSLGMDCKNAVVKTQLELLALLVLIIPIAFIAYKVQKGEFKAHNLKEACISISRCCVDTLFCCKGSKNKSNGSGLSYSQYNDPKAMG